MINRIKQIMDYSQLSQKDFANTLGISESSLSSIFNGRTRPTNNHTQAIHKAYPSININWLLFGEGNMLINQLDEINNQKVNANNAADDSMDLFSNVGSAIETSALNPLRNHQTGSVQNFNTNYNQQNAKNNDKSKNLSIFDEQNAIGREKLVADIKKREIKEIRVFFDDGTYETFSMSK